MDQHAMIHHLINEEEILQKCVYCGTKLKIKNWKSSFDVWKHYKEITCTCGKLNKMRVNFSGSGHDSWAEERMRAAKYMEERVK